MASSAAMADIGEAPLFTCLSCLIAFPNGDDQRAHYRSDHHRYNMKRRVAGLPPVTALVFNQKVLDKRAETALTTADKGATCETCNKTYSTENAYRSHLQSKKHRENDLRIAAAQKNKPLSTEPDASSQEVPSAPEAYSTSQTSSAVVGSTEDSVSSAPITADGDISMQPLPITDVDGNELSPEDEDEVVQTLEERIAAARSRLGPLACLFCSSHSSASSIAENLEHMAKAHSFFIPDAEYLTDPSGLVTYLAEKIAIGNVCLYCNGRGREFRSLHAVRKHMIDKSHCKIGYDTEKDRLEISDFYDFSSSYPVASAPGRKTGRKLLPAPSDNSNEEEWEDEDDAVSTIRDDESVYDESDSDAESEEADGLDANELSYGDTPFELVLPSGARIGHRAMSRYYKQNFAAPLPVRRPAALEGEEKETGAALVRRLMADKNSALVPARGGGFGAFGDGTMTIKARNRGEAKEAGRHVREFRDQKKKEALRTAVGFRNNYQKHFRDPLLQ